MAVYRLKFTPEAFRDIADASEYYEKQKKGLGRRFRALVKGKLMLVRESPLIYALKYADVRFALVDFFPYISISALTRLFILSRFTRYYASIATR